MKSSIQDWSCALIAASHIELHTLIARMPAAQRTSEGKLKDWSPKDELTHLAYWIEVFVSNIDARREGRPLIDTRDYLAMNDAAWDARKDWSWQEVEENLDRVFAAVEVRLDGFSDADLIDPAVFTLEPDRASPKPLIRSLLYELYDHPLHHLVGLYRKFGDAEGLTAMLMRVSAALHMRGTAKWTAATRRKIAKYRAQV